MATLSVDAEFERSFVTLVGGGEILIEGFEQKKVGFLQFLPEMAPE